MPPKGYKSITIPDDIYNHFWREYQKQRQELRLQGIRSFSAFISKKLYELLESGEVASQEEKRRNPK